MVDTALQGAHVNSPHVCLFHRLLPSQRQACCYRGLVAKLCALTLVMVAAIVWTAPRFPSGRVCSAPLGDVMPTSNGGVPCPDNHPVTEFLCSALHKIIIWRKYGELMELCACFLCMALVGLLNLGAILISIRCQWSQSCKSPFLNHLEVGFIAPHFFYEE
jgi:hypothetical protein